MENVVETEELKIERLELGSWATNSYIIQCSRTGKCALVDVPPDAQTILQELNQRIPQIILLTHNHIDHTAGLQAFRNRLNVPLAVHSLDDRDLPFKPEVLLQDNQAIPMGRLVIEVLHTRGHTPGSLCFKVGPYLLAGDTLFPGGPGRTATSQDFEQIIGSIKTRILPLAEETRVYPGHGASTSVLEARQEFALFSSRPHPAGLFGDVEWRSG